MKRTRMPVLNGAIVRRAWNRPLPVRRGPNPHLMNRLAGDPGPCMSLSRFISYTSYRSYTSHRSHLSFASLIAEGRPCP